MMGAVMAIAMNDLRLLMRDRAAAFFTFIFPLMFALLFSFVFKGGGGGGQMKVGLVVEDPGPAAAAFAADIEKADGLQVTRYPSRDPGAEAVRGGDAAALIIIPAGFQEGADGVFTGKAMPVEAIVDPSRTAEAGLLTGKLNELAFRQLSRSFTDTSRMTRLLASAREQLPAYAGPGTPRNAAFSQFFDGVDRLTGELERMKEEDRAVGGAADAGESVGAFNPVEVKVTELARRTDGPRTSSDFAFPQGIAWALMSCVVGFAASIASERARGTLVRLTTAPLTRRQLLAGKALAGFLAAMSVQILLIGVSMLLGTRVDSWGFLALALVCSSLGFIGMSMLLASVIRSEKGAGGLGQAVPMVLAMIGGGTIPLFFMPPFMQTLSNVSPFKWAILAVEGALWRGFTLQQMLLPCGILLTLGLVCFVIGAARLRFE
ncbi:MAG: ABC transporter permease [Phycisphaerales bacterium]|nr:ABC transporter permease [Phycisphaerales bacterium]